MGHCLVSTGCAICEHLNKVSPDAISDKEWNAMGAYKACVQYKKGQAIFFEGDWPKALYYVVSGKVKLYRDTLRGKKYILYIVGARDFIGHRSLLSEEKYAASAMILEDAIICAIPRTTLFVLLQKNTFLAKQMTKDICHKMGIMEEKITDLAYSSVLERLSASLLMLREAYGVKDEQGDLIDIVLSREDLASIVGTATETVIRLLSNLKSEGTLSFRGKKICIKNRDTLTKQAGKMLNNII